MTRSKQGTGCLPEGYRGGCAIRPQAGERLYYIGLGSNLGDRRFHLDKAISFLGGCGRVLKRSSVYETTPVGMPGAGPFLNMVLSLAGSEEPLSLLQHCQEHEAAQGRDRSASHFRDREIDIDILLAGDMVLNSPQLTIPHPWMCERGFVLVPLFEIAPKLVHPIENMTVAHLLSRLKGGERIVKIT